MELDTVDPRTQAGYVPPAEAQAQHLVTERVVAAGLPTEEVVFDDYFGLDVRHKTFLPDGVSYIEHKELNEGERKRIQNESNRDVRLQKVTGDAVIRSRPGDERHALLKAAITGWNLRSGGQEVRFSTQRLDAFLSSASPKVIDSIQKDIYKHNPWLLAEMSVDDIDKQIAELQEMRDVKVREEAGKDSSLT